jgi:hypothetical protein
MSEESFPDDDTGQVLRRLLSRGDDLTKERPVDFTAVFKDKDSAVKFITHFIALNYECILHKELLEGEYFDVKLVKYMAPSWQGITDFELELKHVAEPLGGVVDGWGCFTLNDPPRSPEGFEQRLRLAWRVLRGRVEKGRVGERSRPLSF